MVDLQTSIKSILDSQPLSINDCLEARSSISEMVASNLDYSDFFKFTYTSNNHKVKAFLIIPKKEGKYPCIIFNRGGSKEFGKLTPAYVLSFLGWYASQGYIVIASQYSGNDGGEGQDEFGGTDLYDVLNLKDILDQIPQADTNNIFMMGVSRGAMMTYMAMAKVDWIKAGATIGGRTNIMRSYDTRPELKEFRNDMYDINSEEENIKRSVVYWTDKMSKNTPLLLLHGSADEEVSVLDSLDLASELHKYNHPFALQIFKDGDHALTQYKKERNRAVIEWFKSNMKPE